MASIAGCNLFTTALLETDWRPTAELWLLDFSGGPSGRDSTGSTIRGGRWCYRKLSKPVASGKSRLS
jgi:hypothetical protein